jgi:hypothetical protein
METACLQARGNTTQNRSNSATAGAKVTSRARKRRSKQLNKPQEQKDRERTMLSGLSVLLQ